MDDKIKFTLDYGNIFKLLMRSGVDSFDSWGPIRERGSLKRSSLLKKLLTLSYKKVSVTDGKVFDSINNKYPWKRTPKQYSKIISEMRKLLQSLMVLLC